MKLSILLTAQNTIDTFNQCIFSILESYKKINGLDLEILIYNRLDNLTLISKDNIDITYYEGKNYNFTTDFEFNGFLFEKASGDFVYIIDDDMIVLEDFFESILSFLISYDIIIFKYLNNTINFNNLNFNKNFPLANDKNIFQKRLTNKNLFLINQVIFKKTSILKFPDKNFQGTDFDVFKNINGLVKVINKNLCRFIINDTI